MLRFEHVYYFYGFIVIPVLLIIFLIMMRWRKISLKKLGHVPTIKRLMVDYPVYKHQFKFLVAILALSAIILGLANLQLGSKLEKVKRSGIDIVVALDVSKSMMAEDVRPNRLAKAQRFISKMIENMQNDRIALIVFAGNAYLQMPLTTDYAAAKMFLSTINTDMVPTQGTAISDAINQAVIAFEAGEQKHKALVMISDGEDHEQDALEIAKEVAEEGVSIFTIGVGSVQGAPIPVYRNGWQVDYKKDQSNNIVLSKLNEVMLQQLAAVADGEYIHLSDGGPNDINYLMKALGSIEKKDFEERIYTDYDDKFQYFLSAAFLLLALELLISVRSNKWFSNWSFLKTKEGKHA